MILRVIYILIIAFLLPLGGFANGVIQAKIDSISKAIKKDKKNAELYFKRGELYYVIGYYDDAYYDYLNTKKIDPEWDLINFVIAETLLESGRLHTARNYIDQYLSKYPQAGEAYWIKARINHKARLYSAAVITYDMAFRYIKNLETKHFLYRAEASVAAGKPYYRQALIGIEKGLEQLGPVINLVLIAIAIEIKMKKFTDALSRVEILMDQLPNEELWVFKKGEIQELLEDKNGALQTYDQALNTIRMLPKRKREMKSIKDLEKKIKQNIEKIQNVINEDEK